MPAYEPPVLPNYSFESDTLFESHRGIIRFFRKAVSPAAQAVSFNPNPLIRALNIQAQLNTMYAEREAQRESSRRAMDQLYYELIHNLVLELTADRDRGQEPEDARRVALQPARVQRTRARARSRAPSFTNPRRRSARRGRRHRQRGRVTAGCADDAHSRRRHRPQRAAPARRAYRRKDPVSAAGDVGDDEAGVASSPVAGQFGSPGGSPQPAIGATDGSTEAGPETSAVAPADPGAASARPGFAAPDPTAAPARQPAPARRRSRSPDDEEDDGPDDGAPDTVARVRTGSESRGRRSALRQRSVNGGARAARALHRGAPARGTARSRS